MCEHGTSVVIPINGRTRTVDHCIHHIVSALNAANVLTNGCCCGHGVRPGYIGLDDGRYLVIVRSVDQANELTKDCPPLFPDAGEK